MTSSERALDPWKCARRGVVEEMKRLLERSDVNHWINKKSDDECGNTPLHESSIVGHLEVVKLLLSSGATINSVNNDLWTPLHCAADNGHLEVVKLLLSAGAKINCVNKHGYSPLHWVSGSGHLEIMQLLLSSGAEINGASNDGWTPLHCASDAGNLEVVELLLSSGADINCNDNELWTPLHLASGNGYLEVVKFLLSSGADVSSIDSSGESALDDAISNLQIQIVDILLSAGASLSDDHDLDDIKLLSEEMANVINRHMRWRRRKCFLMFLATQKYLFRRGEEDSGENQEWLESRLLSSAVHRVLMTEDLQRLLASYL